MIKILQINTWLDRGGAANCVSQLSEGLNKREEIRSDILYGFSKNKDLSLQSNTFKLVPNYLRYLQALLSRVIGKNVIIYSRKRFLRKLIENYDIIHIHNLHGYFFMLKNIEFFKKKPVIITMHDFWYITGGCASFDDCNKWNSGCGDCPNLKTYPKSYFFDFTKTMFSEKRDLLAEIPVLEIVTVSNWVATIVKESHLKNRKIHVIHNGLNHTQYKSLLSKEEPSNLGRPKNLLFIANDVNDERKGLKSLLRVLNEIDSSKFTLSIVGGKLNPELEKKYLFDISFRHYGYITDVDNLSKVYSKADLYINPSIGETFGRTNIESLLCGTPVLVYDIPVAREVLEDKAIYVHINNLSDLKSKLETFLDNESNYNPEELRNHAMKYSFEGMLDKHLDLYNNVIK